MRGSYCRLMASGRTIQLEERRASIIVIIVIECFVESPALSRPRSTHLRSLRMQPNDVAAFSRFSYA